MPATTIAAQTLPGAYSTTGLVVTETAADAANANDVVGADSMFLLVRNAGASGRAFTITSVADPITGRLGNASVTIAAGELRVFRLQKAGWANTSTGKIDFSGAHADLKFSLLKF